MSNPTTSIALGSDHAGFRYKESVKRHLEAKGYVVKDFGTFSEASVDYPLFIKPAAQAVANGECELGIVFGGSGNGEAIAANKVRGIRCALCWNQATAQAAKEHNDANVIAIGERMITEEMALKVVDIWLNAKFEGGRHIRRLALLES